MCIFSNRNRSLGSWDKALREIGWTERDIHESDQRMAPFKNVDFDVPYDQLHIETIAVSPDFRRQGLATLMLEKRIAEAKTEGYGAVYLTVLIGDIRAQQVYEKVEFEVIAEKRDPVFEEVTGCPGKALMILSL